MVGQYIASGVLGMQAFRNGWPAAALGYAIHFLIALTAAAVYMRSAATWPLLGRRPYVAGPLFGLVVFAVMNFVVVPLSAVPKSSHSVGWFVNQLFAHIFLIGITIALFTARVRNSIASKPASP